jgi:hypothetical protein
MSSSCVLVGGRHLLTHHCYCLLLLYVSPLQKGQLGHGDQLQRNAPTIVKGMEGMKVMGGGCTASAVSSGGPPPPPPHPPPPTHTHTCTHGQTYTC